MKLDYSLLICGVGGREEEELCLFLCLVGGGIGWNDWMGYGGGVEEIKWCWGGKVSFLGVVFCVGVVFLVLDWVF